MFKKISVCFRHYFQSLFLNLWKTESVGTHLHLFNILESYHYNWSWDRESVPKQLCTYYILNFTF